MLYPSIDELVQRVDSKYTLVVAASMRGRKLLEGAQPIIKAPRSSKVIGIALEEIYHEFMLVEHVEHIE